MTPATTPNPTVPTSQAKPMKLRFQMFRSSFQSWEELFADAAAYATRVGKDKVVNISHSEDNNEGVVVVWYWQ